MNKELISKIDTYSIINENDLMNKLDLLDIKIIQEMINSSNEMILKIAAYHIGGNKYNRIINQFRGYLNRSRHYLKNGNILLTAQKSLKVLYGTANNLIYRALYRRFYKSICVPVDKLAKVEKYVYFPLHFQPEASTVPLGGIFGDQNLIISYLIDFVPDDCFIVVKEHPAMWHRTKAIENIKNVRSYDFYSNLNKDDKVLFVDEDVNPYYLINNSQFTVTVSGSVVLESLLFKKYCLVFGEFQNSSLPNAIQNPFLLDYEELKIKISSNSLNTNNYFLASMVALKEVSINLYDDNTGISSEFVEYLEQLKKTD
jgi:hypothetical protein